MVENKKLSTSEDEYKKMVSYFMLTEPSKLPFGELPTPEWIITLGKDIKSLLSNNTIKKIYYDSEGIIQVV